MNLYDAKWRLPETVELLKKFGHWDDCSSVEQEKLCKSYITELDCADRLLNTNLANLAKQLIQGEITTAKFHSELLDEYRCELSGELMRWSDDLFYADRVPDYPQRGDVAYDMVERSNIEYSNEWKYAA